MSRKVGLFLLFAFSSVLPCYSADAPIIGAEKPIAKNAFAVLSTKSAEGDVISWQVFPNPVKKEFCGGKLFLSGPPGAKYTVLLTVVNFKAEKLDNGQVELVFEGTAPPTPPVPPGPGPEPEPAPNSRFGMVKVSAEGKVAANDPAKAKDLADNARSVASSIAAGAYGQGSQFSPDAALKGWRDGNKAAQVDQTKWSTWATKVSALIQKLDTTGQLKSTGDWAELFNEIATGLQ
jgi:hypothetical protein